MDSKLVKLLKQAEQAAQKLDKAERSFKIAMRDCVVVIGEVRKLVREVKGEKPDKDDKKKAV